MHLGVVASRAIRPAAGLLRKHRRRTALPPAMQSGPLVQLIDADSRDDHTNVLVQFACTVRYLNNAPASHGSNTRITLRLGPDCGSLLYNVPPEFPQIGGGGELLTQARLESVVPGEVILELGWSGTWIS